MGEYEPDDSRNVTLTDQRAPGEPPRTGPREDEARRAAEESARKLAERAQSQQQRQGGQSQSQSQSWSSATSQPAGVQADEQSGLWGNDAPGSTSRSGGQEGSAASATERSPSAGETFADRFDQPFAETAPAPAPIFDPHAGTPATRPQAMHQPTPDNADLIRQQAAMQDSAPRGFGYGADGDAEMDDAPDASDEHAAGAPGDPQAEALRRRDADEAEEPYFKR